VELVPKLDRANRTAFAIGLAAALILLIHRFASRLAAALIVLVLATLTVIALGLDDEEQDVSTVGRVKAGLRA
jgi:MFS superfamily sulfate permease-like transporter